MIKALKRIKNRKKEKGQYFIGVWIVVAAAVLIVLLLLLIGLVLPI